MPNTDGTGPDGIGPMTGLGLGFCERGQRRGMVRSQGWGRRGKCCGYGVPYQPNKKEYIKLLKEEIEDIQAELVELEK